jgi:hypothetical protein
VESSEELDDPLSDCRGRQGDLYLLQLDKRTMYCSPNLSSVLAYSEFINSRDT